MTLTTEQQPTYEVYADFDLCAKCGRYAYCHRRLRILLEGFCWAPWFCETCRPVTEGGAR